MTLFDNKYRIESFRLQGWDYRWEGAYFITICTKNREHYFGHIVDTLHRNVSIPMDCNVSIPTDRNVSNNLPTNLFNNEMQLNEMGKIAYDFWMEIPQHFPHITLDAFVVMPNHVHGILILEGNITDKVKSTVSTKNQFMTSISPKSGSISTIVRSYKSVVSKHIHKFNLDFGWQSLFHDHIIRDSKSFDNIQNYIITNPQRWGDDMFYGNENV